MRKIKGFTLIELLVVIAIIALLLSIITPALTRAKDAARRTLCMTNMRGLITGVHTYANSYKDEIPASIRGANVVWNNTIYFPHTGTTTEDGVTESITAQWYNLGRLWGTKILDDPSVYYCPSQKHPNLLEKNSWKIALDGLPVMAAGGLRSSMPTGYMYGALGQIAKDSIYNDMEFRSMKLTNLKRKALISDTFIPIQGQPTWAHLGKGGAMSVGYGDASVEFKYVSKKVVDEAAKLEASTGDKTLIYRGDAFVGCLMELLGGRPQFMKLHFGIEIE